jgi:ferredoxin
MIPVSAPTLVACLENQHGSHGWLCLPTSYAGALIRVAGEAELPLDPWACRGCGDGVRACPEAALALASQGNP